MSLTDYRDRASVMIWVVLMGLAAQRFLVLPERAITTEVLGSPVTLTITANTLLAVLLMGLVATGTEAIVRAHPLGEAYDDKRRRRLASSAAPSRVSTPLTSDQQFRLARPSHWIYWGAPTGLILVAVFLLPYAPSTAYWVFALAGVGVALGVTVAAIYYTVDPFQRGYRRARLGLNAVTYALALLLFLVVYRTRERSMVSATQVLLVSSLLALELLRSTGRPTILIAIYAGISGLILGQATWVLNYWRLDSLTGGLVLLVLFYDIVGISQHALQGKLRRRIVVEYTLITITAMALIWEFAP